MNMPALVPLNQNHTRPIESGIGVVLADANGLCQLVNGPACRMLGYADADLLSIPLTTLLVGHHGAVLHTGFTSRRLPFRCADGSLLHVLATSSRLDDGSLLLEFQDITLLTRDLESLSRREMHYRTLVEVASDWVWEVDGDGMYTYVSPRCRTLLGYEPNELIGKSPFDLMPPEEADRCRVHYAAIVQTRSQLTDFENINLHRDGHQVVLESCAVPIINERGELAGYRGIDRDITARKKVEQALVHSREMLAEAQRIAHMGNWEWDAEHRRFEFSDGLCRIFGIEPSEFIGTMEAMNNMVHPQDRQLARTAMDRIMRGDKALTVEHRILRTDGTERIIEVRAEPRRDKDGSLRILGTTQDITDRRKAEFGLQQLTQALDNTREAVIILDAQRHVIAINQAFSKMTGFREAEIIGRDPFENRKATIGARVFADIWEIVDRDGRWEGEVQGERSNGELYTEHLTISHLSDLHGQTQNYIAVMADISKQKHSEEQLRYVASHDMLTALPNRQMLTDNLHQRISAGGQGFALLMIDIDGFKTINNSLGQMAGDRMLRVYAERLQGTVRRDDTVARLGGDEFAVVLDGVTDEATAMPVIEKLRQTLCESMAIGKEDIEPVACIGVVFWPTHGNQPESLLQHAETALARAKAQGRDTCLYYTPDMTTNVSEQFSLERALRRAIRSGEGIRAYYQPQIDTTSGVAVGAEALMRWEHPELGEISPARFIPLAEQSELIIELGEWMLDTACADLRRWLDAGLKPIRMAVNVSSREVTSGRLVDHVRSAILRHAIPPELLEIEMTERSLIADTMRAHSVLHELKQLGVFIAIDDFGTGYSSLSYLKSFPLNILKIDKSFIDGIPGDDHDEAIAHAVIAMAHGLKLQVTAEGVETAVQREFLQSHGCDFLQGYLISKPVPAAKFARWLAENS